MPKYEAGTGTLYDAVAQEAASVVIRRYSTSFALASRLLGAGVRGHVEDIYALVRIADEIVDGAAGVRELEKSRILLLLDELETQTEQAIGSGYSTNLIVHAFALTARRSGFGTELTRPFFASMRADLTVAVHTPESIRAYIYGSAEVVGLMCLRAFLLESSDAGADYDALADGARRLGAAFQKVNFLRDLATDSQGLGRSYFPGVTAATLSEADKSAILEEIDGDLRAAAAAMARLPESSRKAVTLAHHLFAELAARIRATPAPALIATRIRVPDPVKLRIAASAALSHRTPDRGSSEPGHKNPGYWTVGGRKAAAGTGRAGR